MEDELKKNILDFVKVLEKKTVSSGEFVPGLYTHLIPANELKLWELYGDLLTRRGYSVTFTKRGSTSLKEIIITAPLPTAEELEPSNTADAKDSELYGQDSINDD